MHNHSGSLEGGKGRIQAAVVCLWSAHPTHCVLPAVEGRARPWLSTLHTRRFL